MDKPNVLLLMTDEHPVFMAGCYGHRSAKTPALDRLASQGSIFDAAYCPSPICAPSRAAMLTERHVHAIEVWDNAAPLRSDWPTFVHSLRHAGYRTILCGKMHFVGPDQYHGFEERWTQDIYPATFNWTRSNRAAVAVNDGQNIYRIYEAGPGRTRDMSYDEEVMFRAEYGLRRMLSRGAEKPFFLCVSFTGPHYPYKAPREYWDLYTDEDVDIPKVPEDYREREHAYVRWLRTHGRFHHIVPDEIARKARRAILGRVSLIDDYVSRLLSLLSGNPNSDAARDTIVIYASDHGDMMGEHGLWFKNAAYEWSSRVPLIFAGPGIPCRRIPEPVSLLDLGPTLCSLLDIEDLCAVSDGRDLSGLLRRERPSAEGLAIMENYGEGVWRGWRMIRQGRYKLNYVPGYDPELFDLEQDPGEWNNIAADPSCRQVRKRLEQQVLTGWNPDECDERRWQSEERRLAIMKAIGSGQPADWQIPSPPVPHPLDYP